VLWLTWRNPGALGPQMIITGASLRVRADLHVAVLGCIKSIAAQTLDVCQAVEKVRQGPTLSARGDKSRRAALGASRLREPR
jgi:hypothetical protein